MTVITKPFCEHFSMETLQLASEQLMVSLKANRGARIGDASVISRQVHMYDPVKPETVQILLNSDAGQTFYHRKDKGKILHIDVFHQCGVLQPEFVAQSIKDALAIFHHRCGDTVGDFYLNPDWIDIQTGGGGGRITGKLCYGKKATLLKAHENHVHVAVMMPSEQLAGLFYVIHAVEKAIAIGKLELRCNESIVHIDNSCNTAVDISPYTTQSDSLLRGDDESLLALSEKAADDHEQDREGDEPAECGSFGKPKSLDSSSKLTAEHQGLSKNGYGVGSEGQVLVKMGEQGILHKFLQYVLPHEHKSVYTWQQTVQSIEEYIHALLRKNRLDKCGIQDKTLPAYVRNRDCKKTSEKLGLASVSKLDISETIHAAACRKVVENQAFLPIRKSDLRHYTPHKQKGSDICFILDASASMGWKRLSAAINFVQQLFSRVRGRIGIISFQDNQAKLNVPLTQSSALLKKGLLDITAFGRTPLALGLNAGVCYLDQVRARNAVIILVTDGLADSADSTMEQSLADAFKAAGKIKKHGYHFIAIGLKPDQDYLMQLSCEAGGVMYAFDEMSNEVLNYDTIFK